MASTSRSYKALPPPRIRPATHADKEAWVTITMAGYDLDPQWQWRFPKRKEFPEDMRRAVGNWFEKSMANVNDTCLVAELPGIGEEELENAEWLVVGHAIWERMDLETVQSGAGAVRPSFNRRDIDLARQKLFIEAIIDAEKKYFGPEWGNKRLELASLVTDPRYHRRGVGRTLTKWGMDKATEGGIPVTLTASPLGKYLYTNMGFLDLGNIECEVQGDKEKAWTAVMIWVPDGWEKRAIPVSG